MAFNSSGSSRRTRYSQFRQAARRHAPSELIPAIAEAAAAQTYEIDVSSWSAGVPPWVYSAIARESLIHGDEFRHKKVDERAFVYMRNLFMDVYEPDAVDAPDIFSLVFSYIYEQSFYQKDEMQEMARSYLLYTQTHVPERYLKPSERDWEEYLGIPLGTAMTAAFMLGALAADNQGRIDPTFFDSEGYAPVEDLVSSRSMRLVLDLLTTTPSAAKARAQALPVLPAALQRFAFNPLVERPFVQFDDEVRYAPQPKFIHRAFSAENLYYRGMSRWSPEFGQAFGSRVEAYTGMQLRHTGMHTVIPEFEWRNPGVGTMRSSDWFLITPVATILIECKSARMSLDAKAGSGTADDLLERYVGNAYRQLTKNAREIRSKNPAFNHIPADRTLIGMVVTAEPMFRANEAALRRRFGTEELQVITASLEDIELLSSLDPESVGRALLAIVSDPELATWSLREAIVQVLGAESLPRNELIQRTFDLLTPFSEYRESQNSPGGQPS